MVDPKRARSRKRRIQPRAHLHTTAPTLDPTTSSGGSLREAADHMVRRGVGRLPVVRREAPTRVVGSLTRSDLLAGHQRWLAETHRREQVLGGSRPRPEARQAPA